ncbi:tetratricopeptide repeat protein, partial [Xanthomonas citri pv. citri]
HKDPANAQAYLERGEARYRKHDLDLALADFDAAITRAPSLPRAHLGRSACLLDQGNPTDALAAADVAIKLKGDDAGAFNLRGIIYERAGNLGAALSDLSEAVRLSPTFATAFVNRSRVLATLGDKLQAASDRAEARRLGADPPIDPNT